MIAVFELAVPAIDSIFKYVLSNRGHLPNIHINTHNINYTYIVV